MANRLTQLESSVWIGHTLPPIARPLRLRMVGRAVGFAMQGLRDAWHTQPNLRIHVCLGAGLFLLGAWCRLALAEWLWVVFAVGLVIFAELMNTAIEHAVNLAVGLRPDPLARRTKDVSASCVLVAVMLASVIETLIFLPHLARG